MPSSALLEYRTNSSGDAVFALINAGGIRASIEEGPITRGEVMTAFPFGNAAIEVTYTGEELRQIFEGLVSGVNQFNDREITSFFQVSTGVQVDYDPEGEIGTRLASLTIAGEPVDDAAEYTIVTLDFLARGGDNILEPVEDVVVLDTVDEILTSYIQAHSPIDFELDGRISANGGSGGRAGESEEESGSGSNSTEPSGSGNRVDLPIGALTFAAAAAVIVAS